MENDVGGYHVLRELGVGIPRRKTEKRNIGRVCREFIRERCAGLCCAEAYAGLTDREGWCGVPYNMDRDVDRLCLENAVHRFLRTGDKKDAFDVYFCYAEIFKPFGTGYKATRLLLETLSEYEENSSTLVLSHRDHYSHSVYVFLIGIVIYSESKLFRDAYNAKYGLAEGPAACCDFLKKWGATALFHDIGYPFEIAHDQIKHLVRRLDGITDPKSPTPGPFVSYGQMADLLRVTRPECLPQLASCPHQDLNGLFASAIGSRLGVEYPSVYALLEKRGEQASEYLDHAYFSGLILLQQKLKGLAAGECITDEDWDILVAIMLHNSLFKRGVNAGKPPMRLHAGQPIAYLLMLCDELQCWDRTAYGQNSRKEVSAWDCDMAVTDGLHVAYYFDEQYYEKAQGAKKYMNMLPQPGKRGSATHVKFVDDIGEIVALDDVGGLYITAAFTPKKKKTGRYLSSSNFLHLYDFALALNGRYESIVDYDSMEEAQMDQRIRSLEQAFAALPLEFKLSNIAQAKEFAWHLEQIGCFYTDRAVDYSVVEDFTPQELAVLSDLEHQRWYREKEEMGWVFGDTYTRAGSAPEVKRQRALKRQHKDMIPFDKLKDEDVLKDSEPMRCMIRLLQLFDGLRIYRTETAPGRVTR